jgi:sirohydrochlorin cobaltochelatase
VLAAHGSRAEPATNEQVRKYAQALASRTAFDEVAVAFHQGEPTFATVLDQLSADDVTVVPLLTSDGYYNDVVLPRELAKARRFPSVRMRQTQPAGTHPQITSLATKRIDHLLSAYELDPGDTSIAIVGHGTPRHSRSRCATVELADAVRARCRTAEVMPIFLDEPPTVESIFELTTRHQFILILFFIGDGAHATRDVPRRIGLTVGEGDCPPFSGHVRDRFIVCDAAIGTDPGIIDILVDLATAEHERTAESAA